MSREVKKKPEEKKVQDSKKELPSFTLDSKSLLDSLSRDIKEIKFNKTQKADNSEIKISSRNMYDVFSRTIKDLTTETIMEETENYSLQKTEPPLPTISPIDEFNLEVIRTKD